MSERKCYYNLFALHGQCQKPARWKGTGCGNGTDAWTWCDEHAPKPEHRVPLESPAPAHTAGQEAK